MARNLDITINVNTGDAKRNLGALEAAMASAKLEAKGAGDRLDDLLDVMAKAGAAAKTQLAPQVQKAGEELATAKEKVKQLNDELKGLTTKTQESGAHLDTFT